jgi:hypothetical protein
VNDSREPARRATACAADRTLHGARDGARADTRWFDGVADHHARETSGRSPYPLDPASERTHGAHATSLLKFDEVLPIIE